MLVTILPSLSQSPFNVVRHRFGVRLRQCVRGNDKQIEFTSSFKNYSLKSPSLPRIFVLIDSMSEFSSKKKNVDLPLFWWQKREFAEQSRRWRWWQWQCWKRTFCNQIAQSNSANIHSFYIKQNSSMQILNCFLFVLCKRRQTNAVCACVGANNKILRSMNK